MPEHYLSTMQEKRLNEVVLAGTHDAGIYGGKEKANITTQDSNILGQAMAGVRFFDLRIATHKTGSGPWAKYEQRAYHLNQGLVYDHSHAIRKHLPGGNSKVASHQNIGHAGGWGGDTLNEMLKQAKSFVTSHPDEFLILKFSKCYNLDNVIATCMEELGDTQFNPRGTMNLNMVQVKTLKSKVITLFPEKELAKLKLPAANHVFGGCMAFRELYDKDNDTCKVYDKFYNGMQYFGKFSSTAKVVKNTQKQAATLNIGALGADRDAMGMMYWTTTGVFGNIKDRNATMWSFGNTKALQDTWTNGLEEAIRNQMGRDFEHARSAQSGKMPRWGGGQWKSFMPNIVMMDFADGPKCQTVFDMNAVAGQQIAQYIAQFGDLMEG